MTKKQTEAKKTIPFGTKFVQSKEDQAYKALLGRASRVILGLGKVKGAWKLCVEGGEEGGKEER